jgi:hypothetical protein
MRRILSALVFVPLASCAVDVYVHDAREPAPATAPAVHEATVTRALSGVVRDASGKPVRAHVAAVGVSGSISQGTDETGRFELANIGWTDFALTASTKDGQFAVLVGVGCDAHGIELTVRPAATLSLRVEGVGSTRCAVFQGGIRFEDFTVHAGEPVQLVVPAGELVVRLYDADTIHAERTTQVAVGDSRSLEFSIGK